MKSFTLQIISIECSWCTSLLSVSNHSGCKSKEHGPLLKELMQTMNFRVTVVEESDVVEICGALKVHLIDLQKREQLPNHLGMI